MKITLLLNGRTEDKYAAEALSYYVKRINHYTGFEITEIPSPKNTRSLTEAIIRDKEAELTEKYISAGDHVILLDERGKEYRSAGFSQFIQRQMNSSIKNLVFVIGGPYGFGEKMLKRANDKLSLSRMTFSHQMVRVIFAEQLYRAFTILRNEPYHHE